MTDPFEPLDDEALVGYLTGTAVDRQERFELVPSEGQWVASFLAENGFGGEAVTKSSGPSPDRRTAMIRLAGLITEC
jgi:hypothetical protein